jgi:amino-acid N-acetyltransferase
VAQVLQPEIFPGPALPGAKRLLASADLPTSDLVDAQLRFFFYTGTATAPTGLVGLELYGESALLRSLVVASSIRASGTGSALLAHAESHARSHGVISLYLLTTTAETFFRQRGYARVARETAPESIRSSREFADLCPAGSAFMVKHL